MKRDIKYIIKRILIGVGIALLLGFLKENVYAVEINDKLAGNNTTLIDYTTMGDYYVSEFYVNYYQSQYTQPIYNESIHTPTTPATSSTNCVGKSFKHSYYANIGSNDPYTIPSYPDTSVLGANYSCSNFSKKYLTLSTIVLDFSNFTMEKDKYYKINMYYLNEYNMSTRDLVINNAINDPEDLKVKVPSGLEVYSMQYLMLDIQDGPYVDLQNTTSSYYNWLTISIILQAKDDVVNPIIYFGYNNSDTLITGNTTYPETFTSNAHLPLLMFNYNKGNSSWANAMNLNATRPFIYEYVVEDPSIQIPDFSSIAEDTLSDINDDITNGIVDGTYTTQNELEAISGGGGGGGIAFGSNNISDILVIPLRFLQKFNSDTTCQPIEIPLPLGNNNTLTLPCVSTFVTSIVGSSLFDIIQLIISVGIGYKLCMSFYYTIIDILDPQKLIVD